VQNDKKRRWPLWREPAALLARLAPRNPPIARTYSDRFPSSPLLSPPVLSPLDAEQGRRQKFFVYGAVTS
jgi:hypothetical protein